MSEINPINYIRNLLTKKDTKPKPPSYHAMTMYFMIEIEDGDEIAMSIDMHGLYAKQKDSLSIAIDTTTAQLENAGLKVKRIRPISIDEYNAKSKDAETNGQTASFQIY